MLPADGTLLDCLQSLRRFAGGDGFGSGENLRELHVEGGRQMENDLEGRATLVPLQEADGGSVDARAVGEFFVGQTLGLPIFGDDFDQRGHYLIDVFFVHRGVSIFL